MKRFLDPCRSRRQSLALLAAGVLPEPEREQVENHLTTCARCRSHFTELKAAAGPLAQWVDGAVQIEPSAAAKERWAKAIRLAARPNMVRPVAQAFGFGGWWREVVWSSRGIWAGLAAVWILILAGHLSLREHPRMLAGKAPPSSREIMMAFREQQSILAELLADHSHVSGGDAERPKFVPKPRTQNVEVSAA